MKPPRLSPREIREIRRLLAADLALPEKYRYILFDAPERGEFVWNGKTRIFPESAFFPRLREIVPPERDGAPLLGAPPISERGEGKEPLENPPWRNKLFAGDNRLALRVLKTDGFREEIEREGGIKLVYIDPPFDCGVIYSAGIELRKKTERTVNGGGNGVLEETAYRDAWGEGPDSFMSMLYERLHLASDLLSEDGSLYVHCDWRVAGKIRLVLDEIFGADNFVNEIIWHYPDKIPPGTRILPRNHDNVFLYAKNRRKRIHNALKVPRDRPIRLPRKKWNGDLGKWKGYLRDDSGKVAYDTVAAKMEDDVWRIPAAPASRGRERLNYPTQKPEELLRRIISISSNPGDIVCDFFCGSGTTVAVAEKMGRKWIACDAGKLALLTSRKRLHRIMEGDLRGERPSSGFEVLELGGGRPPGSARPFGGSGKNTPPGGGKAEDRAYVEKVLRAFRAAKLEGTEGFHGKKGGRLVWVAPPGVAPDAKIVKEMSSRCLKLGAPRADLLASCFDGGIFPAVLEEAEKSGVFLSPRLIPDDLSQGRISVKEGPGFHDAPFLDFEARFSGSSVTVSLTNFSRHNPGGSLEETLATLAPGESRILTGDGGVVKIARDHRGVLKKPETLAPVWSDWVDYWAVDFDFGNPSRLPGGLEKVRLSGVFAHAPVFLNSWRSFRAGSDSSLELESPARVYAPADRKIRIAVMAFDVLGTRALKAKSFPPDALSASPPE
ncbi:MAG: site-specific DNA-methyltransferase [Deltaproteobacteria bacterium]|nr:site-specific DNA-methyltransferase [Deltaproteobacteria bacterium]